MRVVIPHAGASGKTRLDLSPSARDELSSAMLADVLAAALDVGKTWVVSSDPVQDASWIPDPGLGQGAAVEAALQKIGPGRVLVVNSDLPCVTPADLHTLASAGAIAIAAAEDGTTNALGLSDTTLFAPLYGPDSAARFRAHAKRCGIEAVAVERAGLRDDVDSIADLERLAQRCGSHTRAALVNV